MREARTQFSYEEKSVEEKIELAWVKRIAQAGFSATFSFDENFIQRTVEI